jgi:hypothetical protein
MSAAPPSHLIWLDPGGHTGFAWLFEGIFGAFEHPFGEACRVLEVACQSYGHQLHLGYEKFTILPSTHKLSPQPEAYEFPGVVKYLARKYGCRLLEPAQPSDRNLASAAELKTLNWWVPGFDDAQSASLHLLAFLKRENCMPPELVRKLAQARSRTM